METQECNICMVISERRYIDRTEHGVVFVSDNALGPGHLIVAPLTHLRTVMQNPVIAAQLMRLAAMRAAEPCVIMFPVGTEARQMAPHMYAHIIPVALARVDVTSYAEENSSGAARKSGNSGRTVRGRGHVPGGTESSG